MEKRTMMRRANIRKLIMAMAISGLILIALAGCKDFSFFNELGVKDGLTITPASVSILAGGTMSFNAYGGTGNYVFSIISGFNGTIDPASGVYTAPGTSCNDVVMVTDGTNLSATATVSVVTTLDGLEINPKVATLSPGAQITFVATGGNDSSYEYSFQANNSGGTINTATGLYTAGPATGVTDTIIVTDADLTVCPIPANMSVVGATSSVNYSVTGDTFPASVDAGAALSATFEITNIGTGNGAKPVSWWLYLSEDGTFGGDGECLVASNSTGYLDAGDSAVVSPTGNWPNRGGTLTLFVMISAEDDMTHSDDIYEKTDSDITLTVPEVDYEILSVTNLDPTPMIGEEVIGQFRLQNNGADNGSQTIEWQVWLSADDAIGVGDTELYADAAASPLDSYAFVDIDFNTTGFWPAIPGGYYLIARVISAEDTAAGKDGNNDTFLGPIGVTAPTVDYTLTAVEHYGSTEKVPGNTFDARFSYQNAAGADNGISPLSWIAYVSEDLTLGPEDILVDSGTGLSPLDAGASSGWINFSGTWPLHFGKYSVIVAITTADNEPDLSGNELASAPVSTGYYAETEPNDNWTVLPGTDYNVLTGIVPPAPIVLEPGMSIFIQGANVSNVDRDDVFMFNAGTASKITFTVTWATDADDIDLYVWREPGGFPEVIEALGYAENSLSVSITKGTVPDEMYKFIANEDLWFDVYCHIPDGPPPPPHTDVGPYEVVISAE
jgi:hypothetical protein